MARTIDQIRQSIKRSISGIDARLDLEVGPLWDYLIAPIPPELYSLENKIDILKRYYSPSFATVATAEEARNFAVNFATAPSVGGFATCTVTFYRNSAPPSGSTLSVPVGTLVSTQDGNLVYRTTQTAVMSGDYAATYFNPARQRYEINVIVQALTPGTRYNIPPDHIRIMQPRITDFDGIYQVDRAEGGTDPETSVEVARRVQNKFKGLERNSIGGISTMVMDAAPSYVLAVSVVRPTDRVEFRRMTSGPSLDVCIQGFKLQQFYEDYLAVGGETVIPLTTSTADSMSSVSINGTVLDYADWTYIPDNSLEYQGSTRAVPKIQLEAPLVANDIVEIVGTRNYLLDEIQALFIKDDMLFETDILVRSFMELSVIVSLEVRATDGSSDDIYNQILAIITDYVTPVTYIPNMLMADTLRSIIRESIPEIDSIKFLEFRRQYGSINSIETIVPLKNQVPMFDILASSIVVRS